MALENKPATNPNKRPMTVKDINPIHKENKKTIKLLDKMEKKQKKKWWS